MSSLLTYFNDSEVDQIVKASGQVLRAFLAFAVRPSADSVFSQVEDGDEFLENDDELHSIVQDFHANPDGYSDEALLAKGADIAKAHQHLVRIEVRRSQGAEGAAQIAVRGIPGHFRHVACNELLKILPKEIGFSLKQAGYMSFEFNVSGVDKALPLLYLQAFWKDVVGKEATLIAADGDGTTFERPVEDELPMLEDSPVLDELLEFLSIGGVYLIISGNNLQRTETRIIDAIPDDFKSNVLVAANGGADLAKFNNGRLEALEHYRSEALVLLENPPAMEMDVAYLGDDEKETGNDYPAFVAVGKERAVLVKSLDDTRHFIESVNRYLESEGARPVFTSDNVATFKA